MVTAKYIARQRKLRNEIEKKYLKQMKVWKKVSDDFDPANKKVPLKRIIKEREKLSKLARRYNKLI